VTATKNYQLHPDRAGADWAVPVLAMLAFLPVPGSYRAITTRRTTPTTTSMSWLWARNISPEWDPGEDTCSSASGIRRRIEVRTLGRRRVEGSSVSISTPVKVHHE